MPLDSKRCQAEVAAAGLDLWVRTDVHWQISRHGKPVVDFWPTRGKLRLLCARGPAQPGSLQDAIRLATCEISADREYVHPQPSRSAPVPHETPPEPRRPERTIEIALGGGVFQLTPQQAVRVAAHILRQLAERPDGVCF